MFVGVARVVLNIHSAFSLKEKRSVVMRIKERTRSKFNVAIAEVDDQDVWNRATLGLVVVSNDSGHVNSQIDHIFTFIDELHLAELAGQDFTIESF